MVSDKDLQLLDQYVGNRLAAADKAAFEQKLATDATLRRELKVQQTIAEGLRKARAAELKQLLNNVPVSPAPSHGTSPLVQAGLWTLVAALIATGVYFAFFRETAPATTITTTETQQETTATQPLATPAQPAQDQLPATASNEQESSKPTTAAPAATPQQAEAERKAIEVFDPATDADANSSSAVADNAARPANKPSIAVETDATNKKYTFHYQFKEGKLFLYGAFDKNLYEIMEFFADNKRTMFLFYQNNYYLLNEEGEKIKALEPIKDGDLLKKLKEYRGH